MPPATITLAEPARIASCAIITVFMPEPQTLLTVDDAVDSNSPPPSTAWRAGAWPTPAGNTQPIIASVMSSALRPDCATAALMAMEASCGELSDSNCPFMLPMGVRFAATITTDSAMVFSCFLLGTERFVVRFVVRFQCACFLGRFAEQFSANQHPANFICSCPDIIKLGIAQQASGRVFIDVTIATQGLDRFQRDFHG